jgi:ATP-dependent exoDNAse (exonuclease V) beta subunit
LATPEATLALACLRRLVDPHDTVASAEILTRCECELPGEWVADRLSYLAENGKSAAWREQGETAHALLARLAAMRSELPVLSPREALEAVLTECTLPALALRWQQDQSAARLRIANLQALLALAEQYEDLCRSEARAASISGLVLWLYEQAAGLTDALAEPAVDAVKVITHHGAKGLEWPVVILMDLDKAPRSRLWSINAVSTAKLDVSNPLKNRFIHFWPWPFGRQQKVPIAAAIDQTPAAHYYAERATEEEKRLLYVSMTRPRDLLVLARSDRKPEGEWLKTVNAPWLLTEAGRADILLPSGGSIPAETVCFGFPKHPLGSRVIEDPIRWFREPDVITARLPLLLNPSQAQSANVHVIEQLPLGERIVVSNAVDFSALGTAIHACLAAAFAGSVNPLTEERVDALLNGLGAGGCLKAQDVIRQIQALKLFISARWPKSKTISEVPVESVLESGQILRGRIDLLVDTNEGWILFDHKSNPQGSDHWPSLAAEHGGQLKAYKAGVEKASGRPVVDTWLFLPLAAGLVRVGGI